MNERVMTEREKVIKGLECCVADEDCGWVNGDNPKCPYNDYVHGCVGRCMEDALKLMKDEPMVKIHGMEIGKVYSLKKPLLSGKDHVFVTPGWETGRNATDGWISIKDKLPEPRTNVLVAFDNGNTWCLWQDWANGDPRTCFEYGQDDVETVTHWMPMPEAPKEG